MDKILSNVLKKIVEECQKSENQEQIEEYIVNPLVKYIGNKLYPYVLSATLFLGVILLFLMYTFFTIKKLH